MAMIPIYKTCSKCKRKYLWSPETGKMWCPYCGPLGTPGVGDVPWNKPQKIIIGKKK